MNEGNAKMNYNDFLPLFNTLVDAFATTPSAEGFWAKKSQAYYDNLKALPIDKLKIAIFAIAKEEEKFPTINNIRDRIEKGAAYRINETGLTDMEIARIKIENRFRIKAQEKIKNMTKEELAPYRKRAIREISFKDGKVNEVGEMGIFWFIRECLRKEMMNEGLFSLKTERT